VIRRTAIAAALAMGVVTLVPAAATSLAPVPGRPTYRCELESTKLAREITVTIRLRTDEPKDDWRVRLFHDDELVYTKVRTTNPQGNLKVVRTEPNRPGPDTLEARVRNLASGKVCAVDATI
jgi:hypothetical protein